MKIIKAGSKQTFLFGKSGFFARLYSWVNSFHTACAGPYGVLVLMAPCPCYSHMQGKCHSIRHFLQPISKSTEDEKEDITVIHKDSCFLGTAMIFTVPLNIDYEKRFWDILLIDIVEISRFPSPLLLAFGARRAFRFDFRVPPYILEVIYRTVTGGTWLHGCVTVNGAGTTSDWAVRGHGNQRLETNRDLWLCNTSMVGLANVRSADP